MSTQTNKAIIRRFFERLERDQAIPEDLLGPGFLYHVAGNPPLDLEGTRQRITAFSAGFSDSRHVVADLRADGDRVAFRSRVEMTHSGTFMGIAGSGKRISVVEMGFFRIADGQIAEMWGLLDNVDLMRQIGALPPVGT